MEEELAKRVQQLLFERKDEIEAEVLRRVEEAKKVGLGGSGGQSLAPWERELLEPYPLPERITFSFLSGIIECATNICSSPLVFSVS